MSVSLTLRIILLLCRLVSLRYCGKRPVRCYSHSLLSIQRMKRMTPAMCTLTQAMCCQSAFTLSYCYAGCCWASGELEGVRQKTCQVLRPQLPEYTDDVDNDTSYVHCGLAHASQQMLHEDVFTDAVIVVEGQGIPVHRAVLAVNSPVFEQMFLSQMREGKSFVFASCGCPAHSINSCLQAI